MSSRRLPRPQGRHHYRQRHMHALRRLQALEIVSLVCRGLLHLYRYVDQPGLVVGSRDSTAGAQVLSRLKLLFPYKGDLARIAQAKTLLIPAFQRSSSHRADDLRKNNRRQRRLPARGRQLANVRLPHDETKWRHGKIRDILALGFRKKSIMISHWFICLYSSRLL